MLVVQPAQHAKRFVVFDEPHSAHRRGKIVNKIDIRHCAFAVFLLLKIELQIFRFGKHLEPFRKWLHIDGADLLALAEQIGHEVATNEAASAANYDFHRSHSRTQSRYRARLPSGWQIVSGEQAPAVARLSARTSFAIRLCHFERSREISYCFLPNFFSSSLSET